MNVSVVIPAYNAEKTIEATLASVLRQTVEPAEILVMDDGSVDSTAEIVSRYAPRVTLFKQENSGAATARNRLCASSKGDLIAFLDADDLWHPDYLKLQVKNAEQYSDAAAFFTGHEVVDDPQHFRWEDDVVDNTEQRVQRLEPYKFLDNYYKCTGFVSPSFCCVPRWTLSKIGSQPFCVPGVEDVYFFWLVALTGPIIFLPNKLGAYRIVSGSVSDNHLSTFRKSIMVYEQLEEPYKSAADPKLRRVLKDARAACKRRYAKCLMSASRKGEARKIFLQSIFDSQRMGSIIKSAGLMLSTFLPTPIQPKWPSLSRQYVVTARIDDSEKTVGLQAKAGYER